MLANMLNYGRAIRFWLTQFPRYPGSYTLHVRVPHGSDLSRAAAHAGDAVSALGRELTKAHGVWESRRKTKS